MNKTVGFIFISACKRFLFRLVFFQHSNFDAICFTDLFARFLMDGFFEFWTSILSLTIENSRSRFMLELMQVDLNFQMHWLNWTSSPV
jgi:hypothetical protein